MAVSHFIRKDLIGDWDFKFDKSLSLLQKVVSSILGTIVRSHHPPPVFLSVCAALQSCDQLTDTVRAGRMKTLDSNKDPCAMSGEFSNIYVSETMKEQCSRVSIL